MKGRVVRNPMANPGSVTLQYDRISVAYNGTTRDLALFVDDDLMVNAPVPETERQGWLLDCLEAATRAFDTYREAKDPVSAAYALTELNDRMSDLKTYHPGWDSDTGTMPYDRDDDAS